MSGLCRSDGGDVAGRGGGRAGEVGIIRVLRGTPVASSGGAVASGLGVRRGGAGEGFLLDAEVGVEVDGGGVDAFVSEPERDDGGVDAGFEQPHRRGVAQYVGGEVFGGPVTGMPWRAVAVVACQSVLDGVAAERAGRCGSGTPGPCCGSGDSASHWRSAFDGGFGQRGDAVLAPFAVAGDVCACRRDGCRCGPSRSPRRLRSPVWTISSINTRSRRPVQVVGVRRRRAGRRPRRDWSGR